MVGIRGRPRQIYFSCRDTWTSLYLRRWQESPEYYALFSYHIIGQRVWAVASPSFLWRTMQVRITGAVDSSSAFLQDPCYQAPSRHTRYLSIRGRASLRTTGAKSHLIFGNKKKTKKKKTGELIFERHHLLKEGQLRVSNPLLKYIACFNTHT
jgi:hypothetical protein